MSDDSGRDYPGGDPFVDPSDPEAVERAERRREREAKRAEKASKRKQKEAAAPPPPPETPPAPPRTPEQEFWDEPAEPAPPVPGQEPGGLPKADPEKAERGRRRLLGRRKGKAAAAAGGAAAAERAKAPPPPAGESPRPTSPGPATREQPVARQPGPPTTEQPMPKQPEPPADKQPPQPSGPPTTESARPPASPAAETPRPDPGRSTAETPRPDPNQPTASNVAPGDAANPPRGRRAAPPLPVEPTGAGDWEPPPPRDDWFDDDGDFHDDGDPDMVGAARDGRRHGDDGGRRGGIVGALLRHPFRIVGVIVLIVVLLFLNALFQPFHGDGHGRVEVKIPKGSSVGEVGDLLEKKGVISGGFIVSGSTMFQARVTLAGKRSDLFAGKFALEKDMSYGDAIDLLSKEPNVVKPGVVTVTIPEGYTRKQAAQLAKEDGLRGSYLKASKKSKYLNPAKYGGKGATNLEGFLFPDTWELKSHTPAKNLVQLQLEDFKKKIKKVNMKYAKSKNLTIYDVLTIASIIEHEAGAANQRKLVAAVIYNRLHEGMTLGSDATVRYATGNFTKPLTQSQLESESPYNTRNHVGLPPGPISNPGLAAIQAAAHPAKVDYLFFVTSPDCKKLNFATTEAEFERDVKSYEASKCTE